MRGGNYIVTHLKINTYNKLVKQKGFISYTIICYNKYTSKRDRTSQSQEINKIQISGGNNYVRRIFIRFRKV